MWQPDDILALFIPIIAIFAGFGIALAALRHQAKRHQMEHEERMLAIEKGVALPPAALPPPRRRNPYFWGFVLLGLGLAFIIARLIEGRMHLTAGLLMLFAGGGILLAHWIFGREKKHNGGSSIGGLANPNQLS